MPEPLEQPALPDDQARDPQRPADELAPHVVHVAERVTPLGPNLDAEELGDSQHAPGIRSTQRRARSSPRPSPYSAAGLRNRTAESIFRPPPTGRAPPSPARSRSDTAERPAAAPAGAPTRIG